jgi:hypothetical protein
VLRSGDLLPRFEQFLDRLPPSKGKGWQSRVRAHAAKAPTRRLFEVHAIDGAPSLVVGGHDVDLRDLRRTGIVKRHSWDRRARSPLGKLPRAVRCSVESVLADEIGEALPLLAHGEPPDQRWGPASIEAAVRDAARRCSHGVAVLIVPASSRRAGGPIPPLVAAMKQIPRCVAVVELPPGAILPPRGPDSVSADGWLVTADRPPLVRHVTERLSFSYSVNATEVRFAVHEKVGLTLVPNANAKVTHLFLPGGYATGLTAAHMSG